jgi:CheY-like chemotaxis protein
MARRKIFIFEDDEKDFGELKRSIEATQIYKVIPEDFNEMKSAIENNNGIEFAKSLIKENWLELGLIICDLIMTNNENVGANFINEIRENADVLIDKCRCFSPLIPIIAYSGQADGDEFKKAIKNGAFLSWNKPSTDARDRKRNEESWIKLQDCIKWAIARFETQLDTVSNIPRSIRENIPTFRLEHKDRPTAFIMTAFRDKHFVIAKQIKQILSQNGIEGMLATDKSYHSDLWPNIEVYLHGCDFGIGIYANDSIVKENSDTDRGKEDPIRINANLTQEVGYMLALGKKVCIVKDNSLPNLNIDLAGKLYVKYGSDSLESKLKEWLKSSGFIS